jgi:hypothetical protein
MMCSSIASEFFLPSLEMKFVLNGIREELEEMSTTKSEFNSKEVTVPSPGTVPKNLMTPLYLCACA